MAGTVIKEIEGRGKRGKRGERGRRERLEGSL